jgi:hypothetical protein
MDIRTLEAEEKEYFFNYIFYYWGRMRLPFTVIEYRRLNNSVCIRGLQFYTFFEISTGIKRRMVDIGKKITFYFLQNV